MLSRRRERYDRDRRVDKHTAEQAGEVLFGAPKVSNDKKIAATENLESKYLDMRTRIVGNDTMQALTFYNILFEVYGCENARIIGDIVKRQLIGWKGGNREEAVKVLSGNLPKEIEIETGVAE